MDNLKQDKFTVGEDTFIVRRPTVQDMREAQKVWNTAFNDAVKSKAILREKLSDLMREQNLWNDDKEKQFEELRHKILEGERKLAKGGIALKTARQIALDMRKYRYEMREMISERSRLDSDTAQGQADNAKFNYLVAVCLVYDKTQKPYYTSYDEYVDRAGELVAQEGASRFASMLYGLDSNQEQNLVENKFLREFNFVDEKLRLINKDGHLVDVDGRLIDENGRFVDEKGNFVDKDNNPVSADGKYTFDRLPFTDEDDKPVVSPLEATKASKTTPDESDVELGEVTEPVSTTPETSKKRGKQAQAAK